MAQLSTSLGVNKRNLHRRVAAMGALINPFIVSGKNGATMVEDGGIVLLQRLFELERDGLSIEAATHKIRSELKNNQGITVLAEGPSAPTNDTSALSNENHTLLVQELRSDKEYLKTQLASKDIEMEKLISLIQEMQEKIPALTGQTDGQSNGRWHYFKKIFTG